MPARPVLVRTAAAAAAACLLAACSSGSDGAAPPAPAPTRSAPCDASALATHAGVAAGVMKAYVWKPYSAGRFAPGADGRAQAVARARVAVHRIAGELGAVTTVQGCTTSLSVASALTTGSALARSVEAQLTRGKVNGPAIGGLNSAVTTVVQQARETGATVTVTVPTPAALAAG